MEYNTTRNKLLIPEYGRNVQKMVQHMLSIEDRTKRTQYAEMLIELMATLNPNLKIMEDYQHKLWDHLHFISDFTLDVDSPYPTPTREEMSRKPDPLPYPQTKVPVRHFGKNLNAIIEKALAEQDEDKKRSLTQLIGYYMKLAYINWHREPVHDDMIRNELSVLTGGRLQYEPGGFRVYFDTRQNFSNNNNNKGRNNNNNKGRNNNGGNRNNNNNNNNGGGNGGNFSKHRKFKNRNK